MIDEYFSDPAVLERLYLGPLSPHIDTFASLLSEQGYARSTAKEKIRLVADLSHWLCQGQIRVHELDEQRVIEFLRHRGNQNRFRRGAVATLDDLLKQLRDAGVIPVPCPKGDDSPLDYVESAFAQYLALDRGLSHTTVTSYLPFIRRFLSERYGEGPVKLTQLRSNDVTGFVLRHAYDHSPGSAKLMVAALRGFLRFLSIRGEIATELAACVPAVADWRLATLPKSLESEQVERVLEHCDRQTVVGRRDYAILLLLSRLGLRAKEVVALRLEDINWEAGEITIGGKGPRQNRMPLLSDIGKALVAYLQNGRPKCSSRRVFIRANAPFKGFANSVAISTIVRRALDRAGLRPPRKGAHLLRHSLAKQMLRAGASLTEIGEILRHRLPNTTEIYAKVDLEALRRLAQPWPEGVRHE
jgi:site-specific recombinase XerD